MKYLSVVLCSLLLLPVVGSTQQAASGPSFMDIRKSANIYLAKCEAEHPTSLDELSTKDFCRGYITGLADAVQMGMMGVAVGCPAEDATPAQMGRIALKYMQDHPEKTHARTTVLIFESWAAAFPCPAKK